MKHRLGQHSLWFLRALGRSARFPLAISPAFAGALVVLSTCLSWWLLTVPAQAAGPAANVTVQLSPTSIVANGSTTSTATATVKDAVGNFVPGDTVTFTSSDPGEAFAAATGTTDVNGTYATTITSSTTPGTPMITATDSSVTGQATLTQTLGPAAHVTVQLSPSAILADGISRSTATATVGDAFGNPVPSDTVAFTSSDPGDVVSGTTNNNDGTYTATITSSTTFGTPTITATDSSAHVSGQATLTQGGPIQSTTTLSAAQSSAVTNQVVTLSAVALSSVSAFTPSGSIAFENGGTPINGCSNVPVQTQGQIVQCLTSFYASPSPEQLTAVFTPIPGASVAGSASPPDALPVSRDLTSTTLQSQGGTVSVGQMLTLSATVSPAHTGSFQPLGSVEFLNSKAPIAGCTSQPLVPAGGAVTATCPVSFPKTGTQHITAVYSGNQKFNGSTSSSTSIGVTHLPVLGMVRASMLWTWGWHPKYTQILQLLIQSAPFGSTITIKCHGGGCPYAKRVTSIIKVKAKLCKTKQSKHACPAPQTGTVDLVGPFRKHRLHVGDQITIDIARARYVAKYYRFVIRGGRIPLIQIGCVAPGATRPNVGC